MTEGVADGGDGRDGVHDLVRKDAREAYPGLDFGVFHLAADVVDGG